jgi:hypothetical protein
MMFGTFSLQTPAAILASRDVAVSVSKLAEHYTPKPGRVERRAHTSAHPESLSCGPEYAAGAFLPATRLKSKDYGSRIPSELQCHRLLRKEFHPEVTLR